MVRPFRRGIWNRVGLKRGAPVAPSAVQPEALRSWRSCWRQGKVNVFDAGGKRFATGTESETFR